MWDVSKHCSASFGYFFFLHLNCSKAGDDVKLVLSTSSELNLQQTSSLSKTTKYGTFLQARLSIHNYRDSKHLSARFFKDANQMT